MCETKGLLTRMCLEHVNERIAQHERNYPEFAGVYASALERCCKVDEIADLYSWGPATEDWEDYYGLRYLRGDDL